MTQKLLLSGVLLVLLQLPALAQTAEAPTPPSYCKPCLFYSGDYGPKSKNVNGLSNEEDIIVAFSEVFVPFDVPKTQQWKAIGLFTNDFSNVDLLDPKQAVWSISTGLKNGSCGTVVVSGNSHATFRPTGRSSFGLNEYTTLVKIKAAHLKPGRYWLTTVPECTQGSSCDQARYFATEFEGKPVDPFGPPEPCNLSFWRSKYFGKDKCHRMNVSKGCYRFSAGVLGTKQDGEALLDADSQ